ncbi:MAG: hypothetical protein ACE5NG_06185 [bacterium]
MKVDFKERVFPFLVVVACTTLFSACDETNYVLRPGPGTVYFNSFESKNDTVAWRGYGHIEFRNDTPEEGGKRSLYVSGGCIVPHASFVLPSHPEDGYYHLQCWGKNLASGGGVSLTIYGHEDTHQISLQVHESEWTFIEAESTLFCPGNYRMKLTLNSGGIVASAMLVDLIQIIRVK